MNPRLLIRTMPARTVPTGYSLPFLLAGAFCAFGVGMLVGVTL